MFLAGCVVSCGALLVLAGLSKVYRGARRMEGSSAIWRALRVRPRLVPWAELAAGSVECLVGAAVCARVYPVAVGVAMTALGAALCALLGYVRVNRVPGGCGCLGLRRRAEADAATVTWRAMIRAAAVSAAGIVLAAGVSAPGSGAWFYAGVLSGGLVLALLTVRSAVRTPRCHRPLWRPARASMRALTGHEVFAAMASAAGPFGSEASFRRTGCVDEFWFPAEQNGVLFRVSYAVGGALTVHASVRATAACRPGSCVPQRSLEGPRVAKRDGLAGPAAGLVVVIG
jgi:hypothetical protein